MLSPTEKTLLKELLALAPVPEQTLSYNELMGFMFGLTITPVIIPAEEWMTAIFGEDETGITPLDQARSMGTVLNQVYSTFLAQQQQGELYFPYQMETLEEHGLQEVLEWVSGFEEALALRPDLWEPGDDETITPKNIEELYFSMTVIQGLVDPEEIMPFFEQLPDTVFAEAFITFDPNEESKALQVQAFLLATLQEHADRVRETLPPAERPSLEKALRAPGLQTPFPAATGPAGRTGRRSNVIEVDFSRRKKKDQLRNTAAIYQFKVTLRHSKPPIWRRIQVPEFMTLANLHEIIQVSMGWFDSHLHHFEIDHVLYGPAGEETEDWDMESVEDEEKYTIRQLADRIAPHFDYTYDFGDDWQHRITVEKILPAEEGRPYPVLIKGKRACPPEDIGGIWGYQEFLEAYTDPGHEDHDAMHDWAGPDFDAERFYGDDMDEINIELREMFR